jgi:hypothetical protein
MESIILVIMELVIRMHAFVMGTVADYETNKNDPTCLPWSSEPTDEDTGTLKRAMVENPSSALCHRMPEEAGKILFQYLQSVQSLKYEDNPKYVNIANKLAKLTIPVAATAASKKKAPSAQRAALASASNKEAVAAVLHEPPTVKRAAKASTSKK